MWSKFRGTGVALITPFNGDGTVDYDGISRVVEHMVQGGVNYLVVQGTTGESATLSKEEKKGVLEHVIQANDGRLPIVFGHGGNDTRALIDGLADYDFKHVDAILSVSPYYNKPTQQGIYEHYKALGQTCPVPIILYNVPSRTASNVTAETTLQLAHDMENIIAVKEASGDLGQIGRIVAEKPDEFLVISGDDAITLPILSIGGDGVISVVGNAFPKKFSSMVNLALNGEQVQAQYIHHQLAPIIELLFEEGNPGGIKAAMSKLSLCQDHMRLPLVNISKELHRKIDSAIMKMMA